MTTDKSVYLGNPNLKKANATTNFTPEQVEEFIKCSQDPVYFIKNYIKIVSLDDGVINFNLYDFQEKMVTNFHENRFNIAKPCSKNIVDSIFTKIMVNAINLFFA